ncbi:flavin reductase family protein [Pusillimonas sp.]|uniref:flavin reductase family protein n=1 Tax=Pusillimonas sp. TaxID=3040095 RepID=UPI0037C973BE
MISLSCEGMSDSDAYKLLTGAVVPRPIAWISTQSAGQIVNVAPFSSFNYVAHSPPMLAVNITLTDSGGIKDTARNIRDTGEFVVNIATRATLDLMHESSAEYSGDVSEAEELGIALTPGQRVSVPRLAASPVQMECVLSQIVPLGNGINTLYIGEVAMFHLSPDIYNGHHIDSVGMQPVARLGGPLYAALGEIINRTRPSAA